jgi:hypothetical protein
VSATALAIAWRSPAWVLIASKCRRGKLGTRSPQAFEPLLFEGGGDFDASLAGGQLSLGRVGAISPFVNLAPAADYLKRSGLGRVVTFDYALSLACKRILEFHSLTTAGTPPSS